MRNRWNVGKYPVIGWHAQLADEALSDVLRHGDDLGVHRVLDAPGLGYDRDAQGLAYPRFLSGLVMADPVAAFTAIGRTAAVVAHADPEGAVAEGEVEDLDALLPDGPFLRERYNRPALRLMPVRVHGDLTLIVSSCSDIWLPWCSARREADAHRDDLADNRGLAQRHTPRLNAFLARVEELAGRSGGRLRWDPDTTASGLAFQVDDHGVLLDAIDPRERTVWERFGGRNRPDLVEAARRAVARATQDPPPAPYRAAIGLWSDAVDHSVFRADRAATRDVLRAAAVGSVLDGSTRLKVRAGEVQHVYEPDELVP